jgi:hypothetical protein
MRTPIIALVLTLPALAIAQDRIPDDTLRQHNRTCTEKCAESRSQAFCSETCACMADEMQRQWSAEDFTARSAKLSQERNDPEVQAELSRMAGDCARRSGQTAE